MTEFRVWAPRASRMTLQLDGMRHPMTAEPGGWWSATGEGRDYGYVIDDADVPRPEGTLLFAETVLPHLQSA